MASNPAAGIPTRSMMLPAARLSTSVHRRLPRFRRRKLLNLQSFHQPQVQSSSNSGPCDGTSAASSWRQIHRREAVMLSVGLLAGDLCSALGDGMAAAAEFADMPALRGKNYGKTKMQYPDSTETESGLQYNDLRVGSGPTPKLGEIVVVRKISLHVQGTIRHSFSPKLPKLEKKLEVHWDGYTIGHYGRIFESRNKTNGASFEEGDKDFFKFKLGAGEVIPAFEEAVSGMGLGGVISDAGSWCPRNWDILKMTATRGQRALEFVLRNQGLIEKTLLFDIELLKIVPT